MSRYKAPSTLNMETAKQFLQDFINANKNTKGFSQRNVAKKLNWPASYIPDVLAGRKAFTVKRIVELGQYLELPILDLEHLIFLCLAAKNPLTHRKSLNQEALLEEDIFSTQSVLIYESIRWLRGHATLPLLEKVLVDYKIHPQTILNDVHLLAEKGYLLLENDQLQVLKGPAYFSQEKIATLKK